MNNNLLLQAQKWLATIGIKSEACQTFLKVSRKDVDDSGLFETDSFLRELKLGIGSNKLYLGLDDVANYHIKAF